MKCENCGREMTRKEMIEELAEKMGWEENKHYSINEGTYGSSTTASFKKPGIESMVQYVRDKEGEQ